MSLVVARKLGGAVQLVGDTKLTEQSGLLAGNLLRGTLKILIPHPWLAIGFAGNVEVAHRCLAPVLEGALRTRQEVSAHLVEAHNAHQQDADFIVAELHPEPVLDCIRNGQLEADCDAAWIGDYEAFNAFQVAFAACPPGPTEVVNADADLASRLENALRHVIDDPCHPSVGDLTVCVYSYRGRPHFQYLGRTSSVGFHPVTGNPDGSPVSLMAFLGAEGGGFTVNVLPGRAGMLAWAALGIHIAEARAGALFHPRASWTPLPYKNVNAEEFAAAVEKDWSIDIRGVMTVFPPPSGL